MCITTGHSKRCAGYRTEVACSQHIASQLLASRTYCKWSESSVPYQPYAPPAPTSTSTPLTLTPTAHCEYQPPELTSRLGAKLVLAVTVLTGCWNLCTEYLFHILASPSLIPGKKLPRAAHAFVASCDPLKDAVSTTATDTSHKLSAVSPITPGSPVSPIADSACCHNSINSRTAGLKLLAFFKDREVMRFGLAARDPSIRSSRSAAVKCFGSHTHVNGAEVGSCEGSIGRASLGGNSPHALFPSPIDSSSVKGFPRDYSPRRLKAAVLAHRRRMDSAQLAVYDQAWGLDSAGRYFFAIHI